MDTQQGGGSTGTPAKQFVSQGPTAVLSPPNSSVSQRERWVV